ncbi:MAG TPA: ThiF family adenylyltransferase [Terriglobia bacterium]|nr:ThiF family adenylyltransferase [Terriglobia bacterium]
MNLDKYSRQILFRSLGPEGQRTLRRASAVIIGCGALGSASSNALVRAGIGRLRVIDRDYVEESNLQRQLLFDESDAAENLPKATAAATHLRRLNSEVEVEGVVADVDAGSVEAQVRGFDLILDGTDNFESRYLLNDAAIKLGIPWIYGAVVGSYAASLTVIPGRTPCLACAFPSPPQGLQETCDTAGVISPAVAWTAAVQVTESLKILTGQLDRLHGRLLAYDIWTNAFRELTPAIDPECRVCQKHDFAYLDGGRLSRSTVLCGRDSVQIRQAENRGLDLAALRARLEPFGSVRSNEYLLRCHVAPYELTVFADGRAIIKGTSDPAVARRIYAQYIGS